MARTTERRYQTPDPQNPYDQRIGTTIAGKYLLEAAIDSGGMGAVYRARHIELDAPVALKLLHPRMAGEPILAARFRQEAQATVKLDHPGIVRITDFGTTPDGTYYLVMELLEGNSLKDLLQRGPLPTSLAVDLAIQALEALTIAHEAGVVHRDLKPANLFITKKHRRAQLKILDFGIAKLLKESEAGLTQTGDYFGTPAYSSPEQVTNAKLADGRSDVYSMGAVLFYMLTGVRHLPSVGSSTEMLVKIISGDILRHPRSLRPRIPEWLDQIVASALSLDPRDRPTSAEEMAAILTQGARSLNSKDDAELCFPEPTIEFVSRSADRPKGQQCLPTLPDPGQQVGEDEGRVESDYPAHALRGREGSTPHEHLPAATGPATSDLTGQQSASSLVSKTPPQTSPQSTLSSSPSQLFLPPSSSGPAPSSPSTPSSGRPYSIGESDLPVAPGPSNSERSVRPSEDFERRHSPGTRHRSNLLIPALVVGLLVVGLLTWLWSKSFMPGLPSRPDSQTPSADALSTRPMVMPDEDGAILHAEVVFIPGGIFRMGSTPGEIQSAYDWCTQISDGCRKDLYERESPPHDVRISPFFIDKTEVTNFQFAIWLNAQQEILVTSDQRVLVADTLWIDLHPAYSGLVSSGGHIVPRPGFEDRPVVMVTWIAADKYCRSRDKVLPSEAQWEYAARGTGGSRFPWGNDEPACDGVVFGRSPGGQCIAEGGEGVGRVGHAQQDRSPQGVFDLAGNVSEWVADGFLENYPDCGAQCTDPINVGRGQHVFRGGNWGLPAEACRAAGRGRDNSDAARPNLGFRCAAPTSSPPTHKGVIP